MFFAETTPTWKTIMKYGVIVGKLALSACTWAEPVGQLVDFVGKLTEKTKVGEVLNWISKNVFGETNN